MIQIKNITKNYLSGENEVHALKNVSINFRNNEFVSILGPSGCGKTTMLNIIGGLDKYTSGDIVINGVSTKEYKDRDWDAYRNHYIGFIFQSYNLIGHLSILENVELALSIAGISKTEKRKRAIKALKEVGLENQMKKRPNQLSGGQMQRVAIARAIVNEPKIILADEPTGALDSETSVQVMDLLKKISSKYLIIMVTHNEELAKTYSTRIINILDGELTGDTDPYNPDDQEISSDAISVNKSLDRESARKKKNKIKTSMSYGTAFGLSLKNLWSKRGKTFIESLAGSIGIIGIALVLAVSTGMNNYINKVQSDALGNYPITISAISVDMNKFSSFERADDDSEDVSGDVVVPYNPNLRLMAYGHYNNLTSGFVEKVKEFEKNDANSHNPSINMIDYNYYIPVKLLAKNDDGKYQFIQRQNSTSIMSGDISSTIYPINQNMDFVMEQYDLVYGTLPKNNAEGYSNEMVLVIGKGNKISDSVLESIGLKPTKNELGEYENISFEDICNKEYKVLFNDDYYTADSSEFDSITKFDKLDITDQVELYNAYQNASVTLKISGIVRIKEDATSEILSSGLAYTSSFDNFYANNCRNSLIARKQLANKDSLAFYDNYVLSVTELQRILPTEGFSDVAQINNFLNLQYGYTLSNDDAFDVAMQQIGISSIPVSIKFYPKNFDAKDRIISLIDEYNSSVEKDSEKIVYSDTTGFLTTTLGSLVNIVSYVLIAFAGISLVVSSVMIGIITYTSVIERTKEIGVLRSIGARKKDISRIFNSETILIGLFAGILGVTLSWVLTIPLSAIIKTIAGGTITTNMATLKFTHALILVGVSTVLTTIAGTVPARIASKKDPVICLRSE